jgi:hypothetical protein
VRHAEVVRLHQLTDNRTPQQDARAIELDKHGGWQLWQDEAKSYRQQAGFVRGWFGTLRMDAAIGVETLRSQLAKRHYDEPRPFQLDPTIVPLGPIPHDSSYPSGHSGAAAAAATVLSSLEPDKAAHYWQEVHDVEWAREYSGMHLPSDVAAGEALGRQAGSIFD